MAGNPANAAAWTDADVYIAPPGTTNPASALEEFSSDWSLVGLLDGDDGFTQSREEDTEDHYAWGGILVKTTRRNFSLTQTFTALEDNETTRSLVWPGSEAGSIIVPRPARVKIAFETREGGKVLRLISRHEAEVQVNGDVTFAEGSLTRYELIAKIFPDATGVLFDEQKDDGGSV